MSHSTSHSAAPLQYTSRSNPLHVLGDDLEGKNSEADHDAVAVGEWGHLVTPKAGVPRPGPQAQLVETSEAYLYIVDLPGLRRKDFDVRLDSGWKSIVILADENLQQRREMVDKYITGQVDFEGRFFEAFMLPKGTDKKKVRATCTHRGVLTVTVPKKPVQNGLGAKLKSRLGFKPKEPESIYHNEMHKY